MKKILMLASVLVLSVVAVSYAQDDPDEGVLDFGQSVEGEITDQQFEQLYSFEGTAGETVIIEMSTGDEYVLDTYLYLTTLDNDIVAQNDTNYSNYNSSRIIAELPDTATYRIVATRYAGRGGDGEGDFTLTLNRAQTTAAGSTIEGTAIGDDTPPTHVVKVDESGLYAINYQIVRDNGYYPAILVFRVNQESGYEEEIGSINAAGLRGGGMVLQLDADELYIITLPQNYYDYDYEGEALYTVTVNAIEAE